MPVASVPVLSTRRRVALLAFCLILPAATQAQEPGAAGAAESGVVELQASAQVEVVPDLAVLTLAAQQSGSDVAGLTAAVSRTLDAALGAARKVRLVDAASGGFTTQPHWTTVDGRAQRDGWTVRGELILKSADIPTLGRLAGQLAQQGLMVEASGFAISPSLRDREETTLIDAAIGRFKAKAADAARALGYAGYALRSVRIEPVQGQDNPPRPLMLRAEAASPAADIPAIPLAGGRTPLRLTVQGSVQLTR